MDSRRLTTLVSIAVTVLASSSTNVHGRMRPGASAQATPSVTTVGRDWTIAQRVDDRHIVVLFGGGALWVKQSAFDGSTLKTQTLTPGPLIDVPADLAQDVVGQQAHVGDPWIVDTGPRGRYHFRVERFVLGQKDCGEAWGVLGTVTSGEASRFHTVREKYYVARLERPAEPAAAPATSIGPIDFVLDATRRTELTDLLERERRRTLPDVRSEAEREYGWQISRGLKWPTRWRAFDAALDRGEAHLAFDTQAFRLTEDGDARLFVRARWHVSGRLIYALTAWVRVGGTLSIDNVDATSARRMRMSESQGMVFGNEQLGLVLNVFDLDADGRTEILTSVVGYESRNLDLVAYPSDTGQPWVTITTYQDGC